MLNAEFVRISENQYEVFFRGRFFKILPFKYSVVMTAVEQDGVVQLSGSQELGRMFGTFTFAAAATDCQFNANYYSCKDNGQFEHDPLHAGRVVLREVDDAKPRPVVAVHAAEHTATTGRGFDLLMARLAQPRAAERRQCLQRLVLDDDRRASPAARRPR